MSLNFHPKMAAQPYEIPGPRNEHNGRFCQTRRNIRKQLNL